MFEVEQDLSLPDNYLDSDFSINAIWTKMYNYLNPEEKKAPKFSSGAFSLVYWFTGVLSNIVGCGLGTLEFELISVCGIKNR